MRKVPKLRFKEFADEWEKLNAEEIFENISNKKHNGDLPILAVTQDKGVVYRDSLDLKINSSEEGIKNYKIIEPRNFIISLRSFQGGIEYSDILGIGSPAYTILKSKKNIEDIFYKFYLKKSSFISELNKTIEGIRDGKQISYSMFSKLKLPYPAIKEQEKIANFLSSVDKKISLIEEKLELFKEYKKGVMQKIFSQELRFKDNDGNDYPQWEEKRLGEISEVKDGTHDSPKYINNGFPLVTSKNIKNGKIDLDEVNYISKEDYDNINKRSKVSKGDILMGMIGTIGNLSIADREGFAIKNVALIKEKSDLKNNFLIYLLQSDIFYKKIALLNEGGTQKFISLSNIRNLLFFIPTLEEQEKIANFLSSIDIKIENIEKELENLKEFKKGLLQQMFV